MTGPSVGDRYRTERTFTAADVRNFATVTGDTQPRHTDAAGRDRLMVHGLLTGALLTEIGGDLEMLARTMTFHFLRPVYTGDTLRCTWVNEQVTERDDGWDVTAAVTVDRIDSPVDADDAEAADADGVAAGESDADRDAGTHRPTGADEGDETDGTDEPETVLEATVEGLIRK